MWNNLLCQVLEQFFVLVEDAEHVLSMIHRCDCIQVHIGLMRHSELLLQVVQVFDIVLCVHLERPRVRCSFFDQGIAVIVLLEDEV